MEMEDEGQGVEGVVVVVVLGGIPVPGPPSIIVTELHMFITRSMVCNFALPLPLLFPPMSP